MQRRKDIQPKMMYQVNIDTLVPADNFYRKLSQTLELNFLYAATKKYYGNEGQESIDPVVFFKIGASARPIAKTVHFEHNAAEPQQNL